MSDNRITLTDLHKLRRDGSKIAMLTCYDASFATLLENAGVESLLVGDSLGNVLQGHDTTLPVTMADMVYHVGCVARGAKSATQPDRKSTRLNSSHANISYSVFCLK